MNKVEYDYSITKISIISFKTFYLGFHGVFFCHPQIFSGTNGPVVRFILQPCASIKNRLVTVLKIKEKHEDITFMCTCHGKTGNHEKTPLEQKCNK